MENKALVQTGKRQVNIEVLRIVAMLMIISVHYLGKGNTLLPFEGKGFAVNAYIARLLESFAIVAVNIYILIAGYFLVNSKFKLERVFQIWLQVLFYSAGIFLLFKGLGILPEEYNNIYSISVFLTPIGMKHNWFPTIYLMLYCLAPFLAVMAKKITKRQLQACIVILLVLFSKIPQLLYPKGNGFDDNGYGIIWMVCLFMVAAYIKLYVPITAKWVKKTVWYVVFTLVTFVSFFGISYIYNTFGKLDNFTTIFFAYNSPTTILASIALFLAVLNMGKKKKSKKNKRNQVVENSILFIASLTFGVYLIHDHMLLRELWITLWKVPEALGTWYFVFHFIGVVIAVFTICGIIEACRRWIFGFVYRSKLWSAVLKKTKKINIRMNGEV